MKGRKPIPAAIHKLRGNPSKLSEKKLKAPTAEISAPDVPDYLNEDGLREWRRCVEEMTRTRTITKQDAAILSHHCWLFQETERVKRELGDKSRTVFSKRSNLAHNDARMKLVIDLIRLDARLIPELGISPASHSKIVSFDSEPARTPEEQREHELAQKFFGHVSIRPT